MKEVVKKCSTDQMFILKEITSLKIHTLVVNQFIFFVQCVEARPLNRPSFRLPVLGHKKPRSVDCWVGWAVGRENQNKEDRTILSLS